MAKDTKLIAVASQRDSSSMKILALIATIFLPGTFVATVFSMPFFNGGGSISTPSNDSEGNTSDTGLSPGQFWIYWAVSLPLTFLILVICIVWAARQRVRHRKEIDKVTLKSSSIGKQDEMTLVSEIRALVERRTDLGLDPV